MEPNLHSVKDSELPVLKDWLKRFLPDSLKLYYTVDSTLRGRWTGTNFCTLGWPDILAVGEGEVDLSSPCHLYHSEPRTTSVFSPDAEHLETLLLWPGYLDWTRPIAFQAVSDKMRPTIQKVSKAKGGDCKVDQNVVFEASETELPPRSVPDGYVLGVLDPDLHTDFVLSTWSYSRNGADIYIRELLKSFPSVGLFDNQGECVGIELGSEWGTVGKLHVREEHRGRGLGKIITSQLAQKYFCDGLPVITLANIRNEKSRRMHTSCGFREIGFSAWILHYTEDTEELKNNIGYKETKTP